jgi:Fe-S oxidoreductase
LQEGEKAFITKVKGRGHFRKRLKEMGFVGGKEVLVVKKAPLKDPVEYRIMGYDITLRNAEARLIEVERESSFELQEEKQLSYLSEDEVKKIVTGCPHCFNTLKNEYPELGGNYEVVHHTQLIQELLNTGKLKIEGGEFKGKKITFHDPCYLGRGNGEYEAPRQLIQALDAELVEMKRCKTNGLCCGAGGAQMFKEAEKGNKEVNVERTEDALAVKPSVIATGCPFCNTMMTDGVKHFEQEHTIAVKDIAELIAEAVDL